MITQLLIVDMSSKQIGKKCKYSVKCKKKWIFYSVVKCGKLLIVFEFLLLEIV